MIELKNFDFIDAEKCTRNELLEKIREAYGHYQYAGWGVISSLFVEIAKLRGFRPFNRQELNPDVTFSVVLKPFSSVEAAYEYQDNYAPNESSTLRTFRVNANGERQLFGAVFIGKCPPKAYIDKCLRERGVKDFDFSWS